MEFVIEWPVAFRRLRMCRLPVHNCPIFRPSIEAKNSWICGHKVKGKGKKKVSSYIPRNCFHVYHGVQTKASFFG